MKNKFIKPTIKNMLRIFLFLQVIPIVYSFIIPKENLLIFWLGYQSAPLILLIMMPIKPVSQMDEREIFLTLKWQARTLNLVLPCLLFPLIWLAFDPGAHAGYILYSFITPMYFVLMTCSLFYKKKLGQFYVKIQ